MTVAHGPTAERAPTADGGGPPPPSAGGRRDPSPPPSPEQARLRTIILDLLDRRGPGKTICPSDAARRLAGNDFRPLMNTARAAAAELVADGEIEVTQRGEVVDLAEARGPIRLLRRAS